MKKVISAISGEAANFPVEVSVQATAIASGTEDTPVNTEDSPMPLPGVSPKIK